MKALPQLVFDLKRKEQEVVLGGKTYKLVELDGSLRDDVMADSFRRMSFDTGGKAVSLKDVKGMQSKLISLSLVDPDGKPVPQGTINTWPSTVVDALYIAAQELSGLVDEKKKEAAAAQEAEIKNASGASEEPGSR